MQGFWLLHMYLNSSLDLTAKWKEWRENRRWDVGSITTVMAVVDASHGEGDGDGDHRQSSGGCLYMLT